MVGAVEELALAKLRRFLVESDMGGTVVAVELPNEKAGVEEYNMEAVLIGDEVLNG